ncbi:hypothetical protein INR49_016297 [Caranx melampygus]|nr:hypothetical protein INR49_016297 [Caranx melampygus]
MELTSEGADRDESLKRGSPLKARKHTLAGAFKDTLYFLIGRFLKWPMTSKLQLQETGNQPFKGVIAHAQPSHVFDLYSYTVRAGSRALYRPLSAAVVSDARKAEVSRRLQELHLIN